MVDFINTIIQRELFTRLGIEIYDADQNTNTFFVKVSDQVVTELTSKQKVEIATELLHEHGFPGVKLRYKTVTPRVPKAVQRRMRCSKQ